MADPLNNAPTTASSPILVWEAITPADAVNFPNRYRQIRVGGAGTITARQENGSPVTLTVAAGETLDWRPLGIEATGTTATGLFGGY